MSTTSGHHDREKSSPSFIYKRYLHKLPHSVFFVVENHLPSAACMACDETPCMALNQCTKCDLQLCSACAFILVHGNCRGNLKRLVAQVARWKLGYSVEFLEREAEEERVSRVREIESVTDGNDDGEDGDRNENSVHMVVCGESADDGRLWKDSASEDSSDESLSLSQGAMEDSFETVLREWSSIGRSDKAEKHTNNVGLPRALLNKMKEKED